MNPVSKRGTTECNEPHSRGKRNQGKKLYILNDIVSQPVLDARDEECP
jgi:hypothetical protein